MAEDFNTSIINEFRANAGVVGGHFAGKRLALVHHVGRRTGRTLVSPLVAAVDDTVDGEAYLVCGTMGGGPKDPVWIANLEDGPDEVTIEVVGRTLRARPTVFRPASAEWERLYGIWSAYWPDAKEYETRTDRKFPIVRLEPVG